MRLRLATALLLLAAAPAAAADDAAALAAVGRAIDRFVLPGYAALRAEAEELRQTTDALCEQPSPAALEATRSAFGAAVVAWSEIEIVRFGPVTEENRLERLLFWPDRKSIGLKQVQAALAGQDPTAADAASLAGKSVAMQGFGALEFILFGTGAEKLGSGDAYRCAYGRAVAGNIAGIAVAVDAAWREEDGFAGRWRRPAPDNPYYRDATESLTELIEIFINGLELVRDVRINGFLGAEPAADKPRQALFWRSGRTVEALAGNLEGMRRLFEASALGDLTIEPTRWIGESIRFEFANAARAAAGAGGPIAETLQDPEQRGKLDYLRLTTTSLSDLFGMRLAAELGLTAGFSSLDGD